MPTFHDPLADAAEASEALRGLAHASRVFDDPADTYRVFGDLVAGVRSLRQVFDQVAATHLRHQDLAFDDDGDHTAGTASVVAVAERLRHAGTLLAQAHAHLDAAFSHSGRIAWHPAPPPAGPHEPGTPTTPAKRWVSVVFLQGDAADDVVDLIDRAGLTAAFEHLKQWDYGDETTNAALSNGHVYDEPPTSALTATVSDGDYTMTYDRHHGHVHLLRQYPTPADDPRPDELTPRRETAASTRRARPAVQGGRAPDSSWFDNPGGSAATPSRGLSL